MLLNPQATIVDMLEAIRSESDPQKRITLLRQYFHNYPHLSKTRLKSLNSCHLKFAPMKRRILTQLSLGNSGFIW